MTVKVNDFMQNRRVGESKTTTTCSHNKEILNEKLIQRVIIRETERLHESTNVYTLINIIYTIGNVMPFLSWNKLY